MLKVKCCTVATVPTKGRQGYFTAKVAARGGLWRLVWNCLVSRQAEVSSR